MRDREARRSADALRKGLCAPTFRTLSDDRCRELYRQWESRARARVIRELSRLEQIVDEILAEGGD